MKWNEHGFDSEFEVSTPAGVLQLNLQLAGEHNRLNALAAVAAAQVAGADETAIVKGPVRPAASARPACASHPGVAARAW